MTLKTLLADKMPLVGTFLKTPSMMICEVLGRSDLDIVCIDAEHSPFDRRDIDSCIYALERSGKHSLVRIPDNRPEHILNALDCGATGILAPHIITPEDAAALVANAHYGTGRGYAGSSRAAQYGGRKMAEHKEAAALSTVVIAQIEDAEALSCLDQTLGVKGVDAFFIGRADLSVSMGASHPNAPEVIDAVEMICRKGAEVGATVGMFTADLGELKKWRALGASLFLLGSDHSAMLTGMAQMTQTVRATF